MSTESVSTDPGPTDLADREPPTGDTVDVAAGRPTREWFLYVYSAAITTASVVLIMRLWRANTSVPFFSSGDAAISAGYFKNISLTGWITGQANLGVPFGQQSADLVSPGLLNPVLARIVSAVFSDWALAFNLFFLGGFVASALTGVWFFRCVGLGRWMAVVASVLLAIAPYHFIQNQNEIWLSAYFCVPLGLVLILRVTRGEPLWGRRGSGNRAAAWLGGRGAGTAVILVLLAFDGAPYALFTGLLLAVGGAVGLARRFALTRLVGLIAAEAVLVVGFLVDALPHLLRPAVSGPTTALVKAASVELTEIKFAALVFPSPGQPIAFFAKWRGLYDAHFPIPGDTPALGLVAAAGFALLRLVPREQR